MGVWCSKINGRYTAGFDMAQKKLAIPTRFHFKRHLMNTFRIFLAAALLGLASCAGAPSKNFDEKNVTDANALQVGAIALNPVLVEFQPYWLKEQRRLHAQQDINQLQQRFSAALTRALQKHLSTQGWVVTPNAALTLNLKLANTRTNAPDFGGALTKQYVQGDELGSAHFELEIHKGNTLMVQMKDARKATFGIPLQLTETNAGINQQAFNRALIRFMNDALTPEIANTAPNPNALHQ